MQISRSLTIKQMAMVSAVAVVFIFIFVVILLFHFVKQYNYNTAMQMESVARSVRQPLSAAILQADIPAAQILLQQMNPAGVVGRADVVLPDQFQALRYSFSSQQQPVPIMLARLFDIPQQISLPLYSLERPASTQPLAYLVLQADSWRAYRYIVSMISTLITSWLLLSLMLSVAISWCINRLMVHPLRHIARQLNQRQADEITPLPLPALHYDDEIGMIVRNYNLYQQRTQRFYQQTLALAKLPEKLVLHSDSPDSLSPLLILHCPTLNNPSLSAQQRQSLLLAIAEKVQQVLPADLTPALVDNATLAIASHTPLQADALVTLTGQLYHALSELQPLQPLPQRPQFHISSAIISNQPEHQQICQHNLLRANSAQSADKTPVQFLFEAWHPYVLPPAAANADQAISTNQATTTNQVTTTNQSINTTASNPILPARLSNNEP